jgi:hypothetical protein
MSEKYPIPCMSCGKQFEQFHSAGHPDDGKRLACGIMVENMNAGIMAFACGYKTPARESPIKECAVCADCIVTRPACGGCAPVIDAEEANKALALVAELRS